MEVQIRLGAGLSSIAGRVRLTVDLQDGATAADLLENVRRELPVLEAGAGHILCVVDGSQVSAAQVLPAGKEAALLSPAAGG